ncbi:hypothetical protein GOV10_02930 [Candidatus Woesearchaeota archaeon]|nr:hypothetical protein [Candidatus Woesearchaeota archaeon]
MITSDLRNQLFDEIFSDDYSLKLHRELEETLYKECEDFFITRHFIRHNVFPQ